MKNRVDRTKHPVAKFECLACGHTEYRMSALKFGELLQEECQNCGGDMAVVVSGELPTELTEIITLVTQHFEIIDFVVAKNQMMFEVKNGDIKKEFSALLEKIQRKNYIAALRGRGEEVRLFVTRFSKPQREKVVINIILLLSTICTTFFAGYFFIFNQNLLYSAIFSFVIMFMLGAHELGHKIAAWRNGVETSQPYFTPAPSLLGTFGAFIKVKSPIPTKEALVELGANGPLFGFFVAIPFTVLGLLFSKSDPQITPIFPMMPTIFVVLKVVTFGQFSPSIPLNPLVFAGWVMMLVTSLNLLPAGQLDGGHVARGFMSRERHYQLTKILGFVFLFSGFLIPNAPFWLWGFLILFLFGHPHIGPLDDISKISNRHKLLAATTFVVFLLCFPIPFFDVAK